MSEVFLIECGTIHAEGLCDSLFLIDQHPNHRKANVFRAAWTRNLEDRSFLCKWDVAIRKRLNYTDWYFKEKRIRFKMQKKEAHL